MPESGIPDTKYAVIDSAGEPCLLGGYLRYQGGGLYYFEQNDGRKGIVTLDGAETLVEREDLWVMGGRTFCAQGGFCHSMPGSMREADITITGWLLSPRRLIGWGR